MATTLSLLRRKVMRLSMISLLVFISNDYCIAQEWNAPVPIPDLRQITIAWRSLSTPGGQMLEWEFHNHSDSLIVCTYSIFTDINEKLDGRMVMLPHQRKLGGWMMQGREITRLRLQQIIIQPKENDNH